MPLLWEKLKLKADDVCYGQTVLELGQQLAKKHAVEGKDLHVLLVHAQVSCLEQL